ncbi:condensation domain-containing protein [Nocardia sp. MW-W600-9]
MASPATEPQELRYEVQLPADLVGAARKIAASAAVTLPCLLTAVSALTVHHSAGRQRFYLQLPTANRDNAAGNRPNLQANKVPMAIDLSPDRSFGDWVGDVFSEMLTVIEHGRLQIPRIRWAAGILAESGDFFGPIVNVVPFLDAIELGGPATLRPVTIGPFDYLSITFLVHDGAPTVLHLEADGRYFDVVDLRRYADTITAILEQLVWLPDLAIDPRALLDSVPKAQADPLELWQPAQTPRPDIVEYRAPTDDRERTLTEIFAAALGTDSVGVDDNFFDLGGNSLLATKIANRIRDVLGIEVPIRTLFETQTVATLSARLDTEVAVRAPVRAMERPEQLPLSYAQRRMWFVYRFEGPSTTYNMTFALRLRGALDTDALAGALNDLVDRHESLRTVFGEIDGSPVQRVLASSATSVPLDFSSDAVDSAVRAAGDHLFDLSSEIPLRATLVSPGRRSAP